jgi:purine-nucleoside phosphorylase
MPIVTWSSAAGGGNPPASEVEHRPEPCSTSAPSHTIGQLSTTYFDRVDAAAQVLQARLGTVPPVAIVLGSGLGAFAEALSDAIAIPYGDIVHWPAAAVVGHAGKLVAGRFNGRAVIALAGRAHLYEGHAPSVVTFPVRVLGRLGVKTIVLTNAAGGINTQFAQGALMVIDDHINLLGANPLIGPNDDRFGLRFPDMSEVYSRRLRALADESARAVNLRIEHGVYIAVPGPSYETPAEIRAFRALGADAVGMSTVPEAIAARHMGMDVLGISCISNMAAGILPQPLTAEEVIETTHRVRDQFIGLLGGVLERL